MKEQLFVRGERILDVGFHFAAVPGMNPAVRIAQFNGEFVGIDLRYLCRPSRWNR